MHRIFIIAALSLMSCGQVENIAVTEENMDTSSGGPRNLILLIGDGMGEAEIALTRAYEFDGDDGLYVDTMEVRGSVIVKQLMKDDPGKYQFVGESASGGTTISTGQRTSDGHVATTATDGAHIKTILEEAKEKGFKTGLVTTSAITDATPASFAAHAENRYCWKRGDAACEEYGDNPIVDQMLDNNVDVMLGGGWELLDAVDENATLIHQKAIDLGYSVVKDMEDFNNLPVNAKTFGVFSNSHMPVEWQGAGGLGAQVVSLDEEGNIIFPLAERCELNPNHAGIPKLEEMTTYALNNLANDNDTGFFLMIEGASIDKQAHVAKPCGTIGEMLAFDRTVKMAVDFAVEQGNTAVIVTADHGASTQVIYKPEFYRGARTLDNMPGLYQLLLSKGGHELGAYYGTNNTDDQAHTGVNVPIYSYGLPDGAPVTGIIQQDTIYDVMKAYLFQ